MAARDDVHSALSSMYDHICAYKSEVSGLENSVGTAEEEAGSDNENAPAPSESRMDRTVPKIVYTLSSNANVSPTDIRWV